MIDDNWELNLQIGSAAQCAPSQDTKLCARCAVIDFRKIFASTELLDPGKATVVLDLGVLDKESTCAMCQFFHSMQRSPPSFDSGRPFADDAVNSWAVLVSASEMLDGHTGRKKSEPTIFGMAIRSSRVRDPAAAFAIMRWELEGSLILPNGSSTTFGVSPGVAQGARIDPEKVNYQQIQDWLRRCDDKHSGTCCRLPRSCPVQISCVDCYTREIVPMAADADYLALSYVWGDNKTLPEAESVEYLPGDDKLPRVVRDAMIVVRELGKRYLWVDQYCIDQKNEDNKGRQILHMDQVYEGAYATIVAAAGPDADFGLPGVAGRRRKEQLAAETPTITLMQVPWTLGTTLGLSSWMTRGWTYQEAVLSRRLLVFTEQAVYFMCAAMQRCEGVLIGTDDADLGQGERLITLHAKALVVAQGYFDSPEADGYTLLRHLLGHIQHYSPRRLTFQTDRLNAIRGILSRWPFYTYYGIPFAVDDPADSSSSANPELLELGFLRCLYWGVYDATEARLPFPSWSWASRQGSVVYGKSMALPGDIHLPRARIDMPELRSRLQQDGVLKERILPELSPYLHLETLVVRLRFQPSNPFDDIYGDQCALRGILCHCHPSSAHGSANPNDKGSSYPAVDAFWARAIFDDRRPLVTKTSWDCALLFTGPDPYKPLFLLRTFLIIAWQGDIAYRVGRIQIPDNAQWQFDTVMRDVPQETRRITLG